MSRNPTTFRYPFALPEDVHPQVKNALRLTYQGVFDLNQGIAALKKQVDAKSTVAQAVTNQITQVTGGGGGSTPFPPFGNVNLQPGLTPGAYTLAQTDFAGLILVNSSIAFALTLSSGLMPPFFVTVYNFGSATVTATPSLGLVNNAASATVLPGQFSIFYFDGTNWWDVAPIIPVLAQTFAGIASSWIRSYDATTGLFTASQPAASDLSNGTTGSGAVVLASNLPLSATSGSLGGAPILAGQTITIATSVLGATTAMVALASPVTYPGDGFNWDAYVDTADSVTVRLTAVLAGTPNASLYNIRVVR